jgi:hypothetical protein
MDPFSTLSIGTDNASPREGALPFSVFRMLMLVILRDNCLDREVTEVAFDLPCSPPKPSIFTMSSLSISRNHELYSIAGSVIINIVCLEADIHTLMGRLLLIPQNCKIGNVFLEGHCCLRLCHQRVHQALHMPFQFCRRKTQATFAFLQAHIGDSPGEGIWIDCSGRAVTVLGFKLNIVDVARQLGADVETLVRAQSFLLFLYESPFRYILVGLCHGLFKYDLEHFVDAFKMSLKVSSGSLDKVSINFEALSGGGGFATDRE